MDTALTYQAYYTKSNPILNYMTGMLHFKPHDHILEPCGGDGVFIDKILEGTSNVQINVFELNPSAVAGLKSKYGQKSCISIKETDTLLDETILECSQRYDKIIGNPPYGARNDEHKKELLNKLYSALYTKESYTLFLYACTRCLKENGELCFIVPDTFLSLHRHLSIRKFLLTNTKIKELALFPSSFFPGVNFGYANLCIITLEKSSDLSQNLNNEIVVRTNFNTVEELEQRNSGVIKTVSQKSVLESVGSAFMFNSSDRIAELVNDRDVKRIGDMASCLMLASLLLAPLRAEAHESALMAEKSDSVYMVVDELPTFPGGDEKCMHYIAQNLHYPAEMRLQGKSGKLFVSFVVTKKGKVTDVHVVKSPDEGFNEEVVRVIESMPKWKPARVKGKKVACRMNLPILFRLP